MGGVVGRLVDESSRPFAFAPLLHYFRAVADPATDLDGKRSKALQDKVEETLDEVAFEMLGDDYDSTKRQLDSIRARRTKFVCVNDNVRIMTQALADLFARHKERAGYGDHELVFFDSALDAVKKKSV